MDSKQVVCLGDAVLPGGEELNHSKGKDGS